MLSLWRYVCRDDVVDAFAPVGAVSHKTVKGIPSSVTNDVLTTILLRLSCLSLARSVSTFVGDQSISQTIPYISLLMS